MDFNDVIFAVSADCYSSVLIPEASCEERDKLKMVAREAVGVVLDGARDYYMEANLSPAKLLKNKEFFWGLMGEKNVADDVALRLHFFEEVIVNRDEVRESAAALIGSVSARLRWLHTDSFSIEIDDDLIEAVAAIQDETFDQNEVGQIGWREINRIWDNADSEWDRYLVGVMCDVPDSICVTVNGLLNSENSLSYLLKWKRGVSNVDFLLLIDAVERQAISELPTNKNVASQVVEILRLLRK
ncbi:hypothetical protein [Burkholderia sp. Z1]|uniref:hypothetical protein n=1 Tax=Burkholderia sp. Z1 TaxID=2759039 RepID=UPI0018662F26|nr:hypothetical protein [Burkholderia sp. Z1]